MRHFKFRAWWPEQLQMVDGIDLRGHGVWQRDGVIPMQFTGKTDDNGKDIYEGDVVLCRPSADHPDVRTGHYFAASGDNGQFQLIDPADGYTVRDYLAGEAVKGLPVGWGGWDELLVVGDVYRNADLLDIPKP